MSGEDAFVAIIGMIVVAVFSGMTGCDEGGKAERKRAIEAGAAAFQINPKTGEAKFVYLPRP